MGDVVDYSCFFSPLVTFKDSIISSEYRYVCATRKGDYSTCIMFSYWKKKAGLKACGKPNQNIKPITRSCVSMCQTPGRFVFPAVKLMRNGGKNGSTLWDEKTPIHHSLFPAYAREMSRMFYSEAKPHLHTSGKCPADRCVVAAKKTTKWSVTFSSRHVAFKCLLPAPSLLHESSREKSVLQPSKRCISSPWDYIFCVLYSHHTSSGPLPSFWDILLAVGRPF